MGRRGSSFLSRLTITVSRYCSRKRSSVAAQSVATNKFVRGSATSSASMRAKKAASLTADMSYPEYLDRLERSLEQVGFDCEFMPWRPGSFPVDSPAHMDVPFAFKPYCLSEAREHGGKLLLWLDSSCVAVRPLEPIFDQIKRDGYILFRNGHHRVGEPRGARRVGA
jgi:hypothetical protein